MNEPKAKETQQELFTEFSDSPKKPERFAGIARAQKPILFSTNTEQLLMAGILLILLLCGVFFLGVVRGKAISAAVMQPPSSAAAVSLPVRSGLPAPTNRSVSQPAVQAVRPAPPVAVPAPRAQQVSASPVSEKPYTIQLVTHRKKELAEAEMNAMRALGFYSFIIPSGEYFQVCAGQYASKEDAKKDISRFAGKYKDCFLRRR